jgi:hypothetical protein
MRIRLVQPRLKIYIRAAMYFVTVTNSIGVIIGLINLLVNNFVNILAFF